MEGDSADVTKITSSHMLCFVKRYLFAASSLALTYGRHKMQNSNGICSGLSEARLTGVVVC